MNSLTDHFKNLDWASKDPILSINEACKEDKDPNRIDLGIAAYRDEEGNPHVFKVVRKALDEVRADPEHDFEYLPVEGLAKFVEFSQKIAFGLDNRYVKEHEIATVQCPGGTGALRVGFEFLQLFMQGDVYLSDPTWDIFDRVIEKSHLRYVQYRYLKEGTFDFDFENTYNTLSQAPHGSIALFQMCAHNPTGKDPSREEWEKLAALVKEKGLFPVFDSALHGWATGDFTKDREPIDIFLKEGLQLMIAQSFSKNLGLYGERVGAIHVVCSSQETKERVLSQLKAIGRPMFSNAPAIGGRIAAKVMENPEYMQQWEEEFKQILQRIQKMRRALYDELKALRVKGNWDHLVEQTGMFFYSGLTKKQCQTLLEKHHAYVMESGRVTLSGLNEKNVKRFAEAIKDVVDNY